MKMYPLKKLLRTVTYQSDLITTFAALLNRLRDLHIDVEKEDQDKREIVALCLGLCMNMILWRCWSDKLLFEVKKLDHNSTSVSIYAIPNLFRVIVGEDETVTNLNDLVSKLVSLN
jgi:hypothetical protein